MAKYCASCGRLLPEGVEICPDCRTEGPEDGAALFTKITAETEDWKEGKPERLKKRPGQVRPALYAAVGIIAAAAAVTLILLLQPRARVIRAIESGSYDQALSVYWADGNLSAGEGDGSVQQAALRAAENVLEQYKTRELSADAASEALGKLGTFGTGAETLLADAYDEFRSLLLSREHREQGDRLYTAGEYLTAREEYLLVSEDDPDYVNARADADDSVDAYVDSVVAQANVLIQSGDYAGAVGALEDGSRVLLSLTLYSEKLDAKLKATYALYETQLLSEAERLAALGDYGAAAALLTQGMERFSYETETLTAARDNYLLLARDKSLSEAVTRAEALYAEADYEGAFTALEAMEREPDTDLAALTAAIEALERRYSDDKIAEAREIFANTRVNLADAIALLNAAIRVRATDALAEYKAELTGYLPLTLADAVYASKEGIIFRSASFEGLDGTDYEGWIWGENGAAVTFRLEGAYDRLSGVFAVRRDDETEAGGYFELWCDGVMAYRSETLQHLDSVPIAIDADISGCDELTIRFFNDYSVSTSEEGYCYHGLCSPTVTKNIPEEL